MQHQTKIRQTIAGKYELINALKESHLYQWIGAVNLKTQKAHTIQILLNDCQKGQIKEAFDYFDTLKNIRREGIIPPEQVISNNDLPLVIVYPESFGNILDLSKNLDLELVLKYLSEASELLHIVNNKKLIHGQINPKSFILKDNKVYLIGFGYAPFLLQGNENAIKDCEDFLPPEITDANSAQKSRDTIDTYAFAKTVAYWFPNVCNSAWYLQATNLDPNQRFKRMRNLFEELKKALTDAFSNTTEINDDSNQIEMPETEPKIEPQSSGGIIPKHILEIELDPPEAGRVEGGGKYAEGRQVNIKAIAFPTWEFIGWDGDIIQSESSIDLIVQKSLKITARYKRLPKLSVSIQVEIFPLEAREFVKVSGTGNHLLNTTISIHAWSVAPEKWRFSGWGGDIKSLSNPYILSADYDIQAEAQFISVPDSTKFKRSSKQIGGAFVNNPTQETAKIELPTDTQTQPNPKVGGAFCETNAQELIQNEPENQKQVKQTNLGTAFNSTGIEESPPEITSKESIKKTIIGSAFN